MLIDQHKAVKIFGSTVKRSYDLNDIIFQAWNRFTIYKPKVYVTLGSRENYDEENAQVAEFNRVREKIVKTLALFERSKSFSNWVRYKLGKFNEYPELDEFITQLRALEKEYDHYNSVHYKPLPDKINIQPFLEIGTPIWWVTNYYDSIKIEADVVGSYYVSDSRGLISSSNSDRMAYEFTVNMIGLKEKRSFKLDDKGSICNGDVNLRNTTNYVALSYDEARKIAREMAQQRYEQIKKWL